MSQPLPSKRKQLHQLVTEKNHWSGRQLTADERALGFLGWHERGYLPHCDFPNLIQFVTFRLADSLPAARRGEWEQLLEIEDVRERRTQLEDYLDRGLGECRLRDMPMAELTESALRHFHHDRYELLAWCVMPNHVHVLVDVRITPLWKIVQSWKRFIQTQANLSTERQSPTRPDDASQPPGRRPALRQAGDVASLSALCWQREYWDAFMRDEAQQRKAVHYIENNPVKAKLCRTAKAWPGSGARRRDEYERLLL
jgi:type I restriction enzyme R subunit/putative DNA methylase